MKILRRITIKQTVIKISLVILVPPATVQIIWLIQNDINNSVKTLLRNLPISAVGLSPRLSFFALYLMSSVLLKKKLGIAASHQRPMPFARRSVMFMMEFLLLLCWKEEYDVEGFFLPTLRIPAWV